jgi:ABC-type protease/lipase transport system fused ATPase/permease subunit
MGKTVIVVTHKANLLSLSDKTLIMNAGSVQRFVPTKELLQPQQPKAVQPTTVSAVQSH